MSDDTRRRLEDAGRRAVPDPDPAFADALEARLRAVGASLPPAATPPPRRPRPRSRWGLAAGAGAAAALVLAVVLASGLLAPRQVPGVAPELAAPVNVEVALADGTVLEDPDGLLLPEGAVVTVGAGGHARIGDTELGPGDVATVRGGRLEVEHASPVADATPTPSAARRTPRPEATSRTATPRPRPEQTPATPSRSPTATGSPEATPSPLRPPAPTPEPTRRPSATRPPPTASVTPRPTPRATVVRPRLRARLVGEHRIAVRWSATSRASRYVLIATVSRGGTAPAPAYGTSPVLGEFASPPDRPLRYRAPRGVTEVRLQVVALRPDGTVLRRSRVVPVQIPPGDAAGDSSAPPRATPSPTPTRAPAP